MSIILDEQGNEIKFRPVKFTLKQVAEEVGVADSSIRYWSKKFEAFLDIDLNSGWRKEYTDRDIYIFKFINKSSKIDKLTTDQITSLLKEQYKYIEDQGFQKDEENKVLSNEVAINTIIDNRLTERLEDFKENFKDELIVEFSDIVETKVTGVLQQHFLAIEGMLTKNQLQSEVMINEVKNEIAVSVVEKVNETVSESIKESIENSSEIINSTLTRIEAASKERDLVQAEQLKTFLDERKRENEDLMEKNSKKGFFAKIFSK